MRIGRYWNWKRSNTLACCVNVHIASRHLKGKPEMLRNLLHWDLKWLILRWIIAVAPHVFSFFGFIWKKTEGIKIETGGKGDQMHKGQDSVSHSRCKMMFQSVWRFHYYITHQHSLFHAAI